MIKQSLFALCFFTSLSSYAYDPHDVTDQLGKTPPQLEGVGITEQLGKQIDPSLVFTDDNGQKVSLAKFFDNQRPVILSLVYFSCPGLCNYHLNGLTRAFKSLKWTAGTDFTVLSISMDKSETATVASAKKLNYLKEYNRLGAEQGWHFMTGDEANIKKLAEQIGSRFKWLEDRKEFAHASAAIVLTPGGQISRYLHGVEFEQQNLRLALLEASRGKIGSIAEQVMMFCFQFDPQKNTYTLYAWNLMRISGTLMLIVLAVILIPMWRREKQRIAG